MHVYKDSLLLDTLPAALEGSLDIFILVFASQGKADPAEDCIDVSSRRVVVPKNDGIWRDFQPTLAQYYEAAKCRNSVGIEMN
jgi:hypothetical protein